MNIFLIFLCRALHLKEVHIAYRYKWPRPYSFNLQFSSKIHTCIQQGVRLCLPRSYTCAWKSSPGLFTPLRKQHASKIQMTSHYYKIGIVRPLTHCFSSHKKNQPLPRAETPQIQRGTWELFCFSHVLTWIFSEILLGHLQYIDNIFLLTDQKHEHQ